MANTEKKINNSNKQTNKNVLLCKSVLQNEDNFNYSNINAWKPLNPGCFKVLRGASQIPYYTISGRTDY